jgi:Zn-dependent protease
MDEQSQYQTTLRQPCGPTTWEKVKKFFAPLAVVGVLLAKFKAVLIPFLKFFPLLLKTGGSMLLMIWVYAMGEGWPFAIGFVLLIFVHECGHLLVARHLGLKVGAPVFIPFMGALIALKEAPRNAWIEAQVGIGGPILGSVGAALCMPLSEMTGNLLYMKLAHVGFLINLFNLIPIGFLDGGRIATALSPKLWLLGLALLLGLVVMEYPHVSFLLVLILILSLPRVFSLFKKKTAEEQRYFEVTPKQRWSMGALYFGLAAALAFGMQLTYVPVERY